MKKTIALLLLMLFLTACASVGQPYPEDKVGELRIGETTRSEVRQLFGDPWRTGLESGQETWTYGHYRYSVFAAEQTSDLVVRFNEQGRVASYTYNRTLDNEDPETREYAP